MFLLAGRFGFTSDKQLLKISLPEYDSVILIISVFSTFIPIA